MTPGGGEGQLLDTTIENRSLRRIATNLQVIDVQVADADFWRWANAIPCFGGQTHNPWAWVVNVNLSIARVDSGKGNSIPSTQLHQVLDGVNGDLKSHVRRLLMNET